MLGKAIPLVKTDASRSLTPPSSRKSLNAPIPNPCIGRLLWRFDRSVCLCRRQGNRTPERRQGAAQEAYKRRPKKEFARDRTTGKFRAGVDTQKKKSKVRPGRHGGGRGRSRSRQQLHEGRRGYERAEGELEVVPYLTFALSRGGGALLRIQPEGQQQRSA